MALTYAPILAATHAQSGLADFALWAPVQSFDAGGIKVPPIASAANTNAELVTVSGNHTFLLDHGFLKLCAASAKVKIEAKLIGETGSKKLMQQANVFIAGSDADLHAQIMLAMNAPGIWLFKDSECQDPQWYQLGNECIAAYIVEGSFQTGTNKDGVKGWEFTVEWPSPAVWIYTGAITYPSQAVGNPIV